MAKGTQRRLAAIVSADVVGYSRLMGVDETGTLAALRAHRAELIDGKIAGHGGRIVKTMGDGLLLEFPSIVEATQCMVEIQSRMAERNQGVDEDRRIVFRIGVNLGDIIIEGEDILGDGVNIAARLQEIAQPGGVAISGRVHDDVRDRLDTGFTDAGEQSLKNIARPVQVWQWLPSASTTAVPKTGDDPLPLPDKPSIAVLPFDNMSGDPEQEYFSDGITEDIITELSRFGSLFVIARNSSFAYKGQPTNVTDVGKSLGVQYLVEGSVRKVGNRVRITAQLLNTQSGNHLWAERYDRELDDIFEVQDDVVRHIAAAVPGVLDRLAVDEMRRRPPSNLSAYDYELRGRWAYLHLAEGLPVALQWYEKAVAADPGYAQAHAGLGMVLAFSVISLGLEPEIALSRSKQHVQRAVSLDQKNPTVNIFAGLTYHVTGEHELARRHAERAVALNPNDPLSHYVQACALCYTGDPEKALDWLASSERLEPYAPDDQRLDTLCDCHYMLGDYDKIFEIHAVYQNVPAFLYVVLAAAYAQAGRHEEATAAVAEYERTRPDGHTPKLMLESQMKMCSRQDDRDHWLEGYRKAGFEV
jgi:TolB-like protein/class 3 adenylate cyclase/Tfp pilus assembly protein PilF